MEVDRIQQIKGLRIERTGSEQERRRRPQTEEVFQELLEADLEDQDEQDQRKDRQPEPPQPADTVSITGGVPSAPLLNDLVSISTTARVSAEVHNAQDSVKQNGNHAQVDLPTPVEDSPNGHHQPATEANDQPAEDQSSGEDDAPEEDEPVRVDTLA
ncbi:hypothetical protein JW859_08335 [bacterium]|nr:hypothetical protein [bacterium]